MRPSLVAQHIESLPADEKAKFRDSQNFFKHGNVGRKEKGKRKAVPYFPDLTDFFIADNIGTFNRLFGRSSAIMDTFLFWYSLSYHRSRIRLDTLAMKLIGSGYDVATLTSLDRKTFYEIVSPHADANLWEQRPRPS